MIQFVADAMLGRLTRWLRILGYEVVYNHTLSDNQILTVAQSKHAVLLTRDHELHQRAQQQGILSLHLHGATVPDKLVEIATLLSLSFHLDTRVSRCALCGSQLQQVDKTTIQAKVPSGTFNHFSVFWQCTTCGKIYWQGSHWNQISQAMTRITNIIKTNSHARALET